MANVDIGLDPLTDDLPDLPVVITGAELTRQRVRSEVQIIEAEWFMDNTRGLPLITWLTTRGLDQRAALATLEERVRSVPGVVTTLNSQARFGNAVISFQMDVVLDGGEVSELSVQADSSAEAAVNGTPFLVFFRSGSIPGGPAVF